MQHALDLSRARIQNLANSSEASFQYRELMELGDVAIRQLFRTARQQQNQLI